jgi:SAM-dependent methyltransferase
MITDSLLEILKCYKCNGKEIHKKSSNALACTNCSQDFNITEDGIIQMLAPSQLPVPDIYNDPDYLKWQEINADVVSHYVAKANMMLYTIYHSGHVYISNWNDEQKDVKWILDLGCGQGLHYNYFDNIDNVIGVDMNLFSLQALRKKFPQAILIQADILNLPFIDMAMSTIISLYSLEHVYYLDESLTEIRRILGESGKFYVGLPCEGGLAWNLGRKFSVERTISKKHSIDYKKVMKIEHCNTAGKVVKNLMRHFNLDRKKFFPLFFIPSILFNLIITMQLSNKSME